MDAGLAAVLIVIAFVLGFGGAVYWFLGAGENDGDLDD
jgi:hypothetical protein